MYNCEIIFFDLETTSLRRDSHILDVAAVSCDGQRSFQSHVRPGCNIAPGATGVHGLFMDNGDLCKRYPNGHVDCLDASNPYDAMNEFLDFLLEEASGGQVVLAAHNGFAFDSKVLKNQFKRVGLEEELSETVAGFADTLYLARAERRDLRSHTLDALIQTYGLKQRGHHNALEDARLTRRVAYRLCEVPYGDQRSFEQTFLDGDHVREYEN